MKKTTTVFIVIILLALTFVASTNALAMKKQTRKKAKSVTAQVINPTGISAITMGRSACYGKCPVYSIEVHANGLLTYTGKWEVPFIGVYEKQISAAEAVQLLKDFAAYRPDTCSYMYKSVIPDLPGIHYFVSYKDSVKRIINAQAGPDFLRDMAIEFDKYSKVDKSWKQISKTVK